MAKRIKNLIYYFRYILCILGVAILFINMYGCQSDKVESQTADLDYYSNFLFLNDLSSDNFQNMELKQVMDLSVEIKKLLSSNQYDKAFILLEEYIKDHPNDIYMKYQLAYLLYMKKDYKNALYVSEGLLNQKDSNFYTKDDSRYQLLYSDILIETSDLDKATEELKTIIRTNPCSRAFTFLAKLYIKQHKYSAARYVLKKAEDYYLAYESDTKEVKFQDDFKAVNDSQILDSYSAILFWRGYIDIYEKDFDTAKSNLDKIDSRYQESSDLVYLYGLYYYSVGQVDKAREYTASLNIREPSFRGHYLEAKIFETKKDYSRQASSLTLALKYKEDNQAKLDLAQVYFRHLNEHYKAYVLASQVKQLGNESQQHEARVILSGLDDKQ